MTFLFSYKFDNRFRATFFMPAKILAISKPPEGETLAKLIAQFISLGWWDRMTVIEREAFFSRGEVLDSPFARSTLLPIIQRSNSRKET